MANLSSFSTGNLTPEINEDAGKMIPSIDKKTVRRYIKFFQKAIRLAPNDSHLVQKLCKIVQDAKIWDVNDISFNLAKILRAGLHVDKLQTIIHQAKAKDFILPDDETELRRLWGYFSQDIYNRYVDSKEISDMWQEANVREADSQFAPNAGQHQISRDHDGDVRMNEASEQPQSIRPKGPVSMINQTEKQELGKLFKVLQETFQSLSNDFKRDNGMDWKKHAAFKKLNDGVVALGGKNMKRRADAGESVDGNGVRIGSIPALELVELWIQLWKKQLSQDSYDLKANALWKEWQFPRSWTSLPPVEGNEYPSTAQVNEMYDPVGSNEGSGNAEAETSDSDSSEDSEASSESEPSTDEDDRKARRAAKKRSRSHKKSKRSKTKVDRSTPRANSRSAAALIPYSSQDPRTKISTVFKTQPISNSIRKANHTDEGHKIVGWRQTTYKVFGDADGFIERSKRSYCVKVSKYEYQYREENECGGQIVWHQLDKTKVPEVGGSLDSIPGNGVIGRREWGLDWVAIAPSIKVAPEKLPVMVCAIWWQVNDAGTKKRALLFRSDLHRKISGKLADTMIRRCAARGKSSGDLWQCLSVQNPHVNPPPRYGGSRSGQVARIEYRSPNHNQMQLYRRKHKVVDSTDESDASSRSESSSDTSESSDNIEDDNSTDETDDDMSSRRGARGELKMKKRLKVIESHMEELREGMRKLILEKPKSKHEKEKEKKKKNR